MPKLNPRLRTVGRCIRSMHDRWECCDDINGNDDVLSDIEVDLEHALTELREFRREDRAGDPSPALVRAAKAQWAREAKEREQAVCAHVWVTDEYNIDACAKCGEERGENR